MQVMIWVMAVMLTALQPETARDYTTEMPAVVDRQTSVSAAVEQADLVVLVELRARAFAIESSEFSGQPNVFDTIHADSSVLVIDVIKGAVYAGDQIQVRTVGGRRVGGHLRAHESDPLVTGKRYVMFLKRDSEANGTAPVYRPVHEMLSIYGVEGGRVHALLRGRLSAQFEGMPVKSVVDELKANHPVK